MSDPKNVVVINQNPEKEKKKRGRPRKNISKIAGAVPDIGQKFRIFKTIQEPNMLKNVDVQQQDLTEKIKEAFGEKQDIGEMVRETFNSNNESVITGKSKNDIVSRDLSNEQIAMNKKLAEDNRQAILIGNELKKIKDENDLQRAREIISGLVEKKKKNKQEKEDASISLQAAMRRRLESDSVKKAIEDDIKTAKELDRQKIIEEYDILNQLKQSSGREAADLAKQKRDSRMEAKARELGLEVAKEAASIGAKKESKRKAKEDAEIRKKRVDAALNSASTVAKESFGKVSNTASDLFDKAQSATSDLFRKKKNEEITPIPSQSDRAKARNILDSLTPLKRQKDISKKIDDISEAAKKENQAKAARRELGKKAGEEAAKKAAQQAAARELQAAARRRQQNENYNEKWDGMKKRADGNLDRRSFNVGRGLKKDGTTPSGLGNAGINRDNSGIRKKSMNKKKK